MYDDLSSLTAKLKMSGVSFQKINDEDGATMQTAVTVTTPDVNGDVKETIVETVPADIHRKLSTGTQRQYPLTAESKTCAGTKRVFLSDRWHSGKCCGHVPPDVRTGNSRTQPGTSGRVIYRHWQITPPNYRVGAQFSHKRVLTQVRKLAARCAFRQGLFSLTSHDF